MAAQQSAAIRVISIYFFPLKFIIKCFLYICYKKTIWTKINRTDRKKPEPRGSGEGCESILIMPEGIIAVGLASGDSTGIEAQSDGADGTAPMVLTRRRQCHPGPAGIGIVSG